MSFTTAGMEPIKGVGILNASQEMGQLNEAARLIENQRMDNAAFAELPAAFRLTPCRCDFCVISGDPEWL